MNIQEDYCSYEVSKLLKEKGFDEIECVGYYCDDKPKEVQISYCGETNSTWKKRCCQAPTHQMAMKWLREEQNLYIEIRRNLNTFYYGWKVEQGMSVKAIFDYKYDSYEQAVEAALLYVLKNLI